MSNITEVKVPDIGGAENVDVIEIAVKKGDRVAKEDSLVTLESDKASMDIPSPYAGVVENIKLSVGDKVSEGALILTLTTDAAVSDTKKADAVKKPEKIAEPVKAAAKTTNAASEIYAGPGVRRLAYQEGVDLNQVMGTGRKGRIVKEDVEQYLGGAGSAAKPGFALDISPLPATDFSKFGAVETVPLSKIKKISGAVLHRNWVTVPHVTQFDEADITDLEAYRKSQKTLADQHGTKLTPLVFIMKAVVAALKEYPVFNSSLDATGEQLIMKKYYHIGVAVDTPNGLVVPVIRDVDQKGCIQLAKELAAISQKAREKGLSPADMQGGCFSISSLGGIGGTAFTPIVNLPEAAILGVSRSEIKPVYQEGEFVPRLILPLSLSYDHRVIDGADAARFCQALVKYLSDLRNLLM